MSSSLAERLGFDASDRVAIIHCDDIGMCHAANEGSFEALENGPATSGSVMVPCPWFAEVALRARGRSDLDLGVHLTLNSEWPHYRWGPVAGAKAVPSLVDDQGYLPRTSAETISRARPEEAATELRAQIERALEAGIDVTHLDAHMGTCFIPPLTEVYGELIREFQLPALLARPDAAQLRAAGLGEIGDAALEFVDALEAEGVPVLDALDAASLDFDAGLGAVHNARRLDALQPGITYLICHPARAGEELAAITQSAHARDFERRFYGGEAGRRALESRGIRTLGMRPLRDLMRGERTASELP